MELEGDDIFIYFESVLKYKNIYLLILTDNKTYKQYVGINHLLSCLGLNERQIEYIRQKWKKNNILRSNMRDIKTDIYNKSGGAQNINCIHINYLPIAFTEINKKILTEPNYNKMLNILNYIINTDYKIIEGEEKVYAFESHLRDELVEIGYFDNIKIIDKEVKYDFGRIDLLGKDPTNKSVCIELKKYKEFENTKEQLITYKNSNQFNKIIYCAYTIDDEFKSWCLLNDIEVYTYERKLHIKTA